MHKDGTESGFDCDITGKISKSLPIQVIASGGASTPAHLAEAFHKGADAVLAATMFHSGNYTIGTVKDYLINNNI